MVNRIIFLLLFCYTICNESYAQTNAPTKEELAEYVRQKLLTYNLNVHPSPNDIKISTSDCTMTMQYSNGSREIIYLSNLNASSIKYLDVSNLEGKISINSINDKIAFHYYNSEGKLIYTSATLIIKYDEKNLKMNPNDKERIVKALKALILACGGKETKELF